jgi:hypothetical protein
MAHFAEIDENNIVIRVIPFSDDLEENGETFIAEEVGGVWKRTSYNTFGNAHRLGGTAFRFNYAGIGYLFDETKGTDGAFIAPQTYPSWLLNETTCLWEAPVPYPGGIDDSGYVWDESILNWVKLP